MIEPTLCVSVLSAEQIGRIHQAAMAVLNGANLVHDVGYIESGKTASLEMVVISARGP